MPRIFISYSHVDRPFVDSFVPLLRRVYGHNNVWFDDRLRGGQLWWKEILQQISACDIFIYLLSHKSLMSKACQAEFDEAHRLRKPILPIRLQPGLQIPTKISQYQYIDLSKGILPDSLAKLYGAIQFLSETTSPTYPSVFAPTSATLPSPPRQPQRQQQRSLSRRVVVVGIILLLLLGSVGFLIVTNGDRSSDALSTQSTNIPNSRPTTVEVTESRGANIQLRYTSESLTLENIGTEHLDISDLVFEGDAKGRFLATGWSEDNPIGGILRYFRPNGCVHLVTVRSAVPNNCRYYGYWSWRSTEDYHFWIENDGNTVFYVKVDDVIITECPIVTFSEQRCEFVLP